MSESIACRTCAVTMTTEHCERGDGATTCWHVCPVCGHRRMTSELGVYEARGARRAPVGTVAAAVPSAPSREDDDEAY